MAEIVLKRRYLKVLSRKYDEKENLCHEVGKMLKKIYRYLRETLQVWRDKKLIGIVLVSLRGMYVSYVMVF